MKIYMIYACIICIYNFLCKIYVYNRRKMLWAIGLRSPLHKVIGYGFAYIIWAPVRQIFEQTTSRCRLYRRLKGPVSTCERLCMFACLYVRLLMCV